MYQLEEVAEPMSHAETTAVGVVVVVAGLDRGVYVGHCSTHALRGQVD